MAAEDTGLADASETELADAVAGGWAAKGYRTTTKEQGSNVFVFAKRRDGDALDSRVVWVAAQRRVGESQLRQLRSLAENVGASAATCLTVGDGTVTEPSVADDLGIERLDGADLRTDPDVEIDAGPAGGPRDDPDGQTDGHSQPDAGSESSVGADGSVAADAGRHAGSTGERTDPGGPAAPEDEDGYAGAGVDADPGRGDATEAPTGASRGVDESTRQRDSGGDQWDGQTTAGGGGRFVAAWDAVTDGRDVGAFPGPELWDGTTR